MVDIKCIFKNVANSILKCNITLSHEIGPLGTLFPMISLLGWFVIKRSEDTQESFALRHV